MRKKRMLGWGLAIGLVLAAGPAAAQEMSGKAPQTPAEITEWKKSAPRIYVDFDDGDLDYIRTQIPFVNYVRDRKEADVHILVTTQATGSGGMEYTLAFLGLGNYADVSNTLIYASPTTATEDEIRKGYVSVLKMGLIPYVARTPIRDLIRVEYKESLRPTDVVDPWKFWVFSLSIGGDLYHESRTKSESVWLSASANKITPEWKTRLGLSTFFARDEFRFGEELIHSRSQSVEAAGLFAKSLGEHWSAGVYVEAGASTYHNLRSTIAPAPILEFNLFPYSESTRRQLRLAYMVKIDFARYREETIYEKTKETLFGQMLSAVLEIKEPWGTLEAGLEGSNYFHDFSKNRLEFNGEAAVRIVKGLDFVVDVHYERVRDQLSLPKGDLSLEEVLLRRREMATDYSLGFEVGLSFTFGSIFSNVVNPRFGNLGRIDDYYD